MSRFSPTVAPNAGEAFGRALQQSVGAYLQARQQKQTDEAEMLGRGYVPVDSSSPIKGPHTPPIVEPQAPAINQGALNTLVAGNTGASALPVANPIPSAPTSRGAVTPVDQITPMGQSFGAMLGAQSKPLQVSQPAQPAGVSPQALSKASGMDAYQQQAPSSYTPTPVHLLGRDWQMTPQALASMQMQMATARAGLEHTGSETAKNYRDIGTPRLGDANYAGAMGQVAGAQAAATAPIDVQKEVAIAAAKLPIETQKMLNEKAAEFANAKSLEEIRASVQSALQHNQLQFDAGKLTQEEKFVADQQTNRLAGEFVNQSALTNQRARGTITGKMFAPAPLTSAPSNGVGASNAQRADWDNAAAALRAQQKDPTAVLGPRP